MTNQTIIDFERVLAPISPEQPAGVDLRAAPRTSVLLDEIRSVRDEAVALEEGGIGVNATRNQNADSVRSDWETVFAKSIDVLTRESKDIWVTMWLLEAVVRFFGFTGLRDGIRLLRLLCELYWDCLFPPPDHYGIAARMAAFSILSTPNHDGGLEAVLLDVPVSSSTRFGCFSTRDFCQTVLGAEQQAALQDSANDTSSVFLGNVHRDLVHSLEEFRQLEALLDEKCGPNATSRPAFSSIVEAIRRCQSVVKQLARQHLRRKDGTTPRFQFSFEDDRAETFGRKYSWALAAFIPERGAHDERKLAASPEPYFDDNVQFTLYRPKVVVPERWYPMLVFVHLDDLPFDAPVDEPDPLEVVKEQAKAILGEQFPGFRQVNQDSECCVPREGELTFVPEVPGVTFDPPRQTLLWHGAVRHHEFQLQAGAELDGSTARGHLTVFLGHILLATIPIRLQVNRVHVSRQCGVDTNHVRPYRKIFASYSHQDGAIVEELERYGRALGDAYLRDAISLRAGEQWNDRLEELIHNADAFQLFWSRNSMYSKFVEREWRYALSLNRPNFVRPTYWEEPLPSDTSRNLPPDELARLHFQKLDTRPQYHGDWATLRSSPDSRYLGLTLPRHLSRRTYTAPSATAQPVTGAADSHGAGDASRTVDDAAAADHPNKDVSKPSHPRSSGAKSSSQRFIGRNRSPRVHITYETEAEGIPIQRELPFVIGVLGDFSGSGANKVPLKGQEFLPIDRDNFDHVMRAIGPHLDLSVANLLVGDGSTLVVQLKFESMDDFGPERIVEQVPPLNELLAARRRLAELRHRMDGNQELEALLDRLLKDRDAQQSLAKELDEASSATAEDAGEAQASGTALIDEQVQFTVFRPKVVAPERWYSMLVFAHRDELAVNESTDEPNPMELVRARAEAILGKSLREYRHTSEESELAVPREHELWLIPEVPGCQFRPAQQAILWLGEVHHQEFQFKASSQLHGTTARGHVNVYLGHLLLASIPISFRVDNNMARAATPTVEQQSVSRYRRIFASYSHRDAAIVEECERFGRLLGDTYLRDAVNLRAGERWSARLEALIREADVFQLFWSTNSMYSRFVEREWRYAMSLNRPSFVRPTYWETPLPANPDKQLPPPELSNLHFQYFIPRKHGRPEHTPHEGTSLPPPDIVGDRPPSDGVGIGDAAAKQVRGAETTTQPARAGRTLLDLVIGETTRPEQDTPKEMAELLASFCKVVGKRTALYSDSMGSTIDHAIAAIDKKLSAQLNHILHHQQFQELEGTWRGLLHLVANTETSEHLQIRALDCTKEQLAADCRDVDDVRRSSLFTFLETGFRARRPYGLVIGDFRFDHSKSDVELLTSVSTVSAFWFCPFVSAVSPSMFGLSNWAELDKIENVFRMFAASQYDAWNSFRKRVDSRFVVLTMPRTLARLPYGNHNPVDEFDYDESESAEPGNGRQFCWMNTAYVYTARIADSFTRYGWFSMIRGFEAGGLVEDLPTYAFTNADGDVTFACPSEIAIDFRRERDLSHNGFVPLVHDTKSNRAAFVSARTTWAHSAFRDPAVCANAEFSWQLSDVLIASRFAQYIREISRNRFASCTDAKQLESLLNDWIGRYVMQDIGASTQADHARRPLADAVVKVTKSPGQPGRYRATVTVRPYQQLEGLTSSLSLEADLFSSADVGVLSVEDIAEEQREEATRAQKRKSGLCLDDHVHFTAYRPRVVVPEQWYSMLVFAHRDAIDIVRSQAEAILGDRALECLETSDESDQSIPPEGEITFVPHVPGVTFHPPCMSILWLGQVEHVAFKLRAGSESDGKTVRGTLTVFLGNIVLAEIPIKMRVDKQHVSQSQAESVQSVHPYRKIFASYSHLDRRIVEEFEHFVGTLGDMYLRDAVNLRAGEHWTSRLEELIKEADVFQLFWSSNSMYSNFVEREWRYALSLSRSAFVRPTYWEEPLPADPKKGLPPLELARLHFQRLRGNLPH